MVQLSLHGLWKERPSIRNFKLTLRSRFMARMMKMSCAILAFSAVPRFAQATAPPALGKAFSVPMAVTPNAPSMPEADNLGSRVVAVSGDNKLSFGPDPGPPR